LDVIHKPFQKKKKKILEYLHLFKIPKLLVQKKKKIKKSSNSRKSNSGNQNCGNSVIQTWNSGIANSPTGIAIFSDINDKIHNPNVK